MRAAWLKRRSSGALVGMAILCFIKITYSKRREKLFFTSNVYGKSQQKILNTSSQRKRQKIEKNGDTSDVTSQFAVIFWWSHHWILVKTTTCLLATSLNAFLHMGCFAVGYWIFYPCVFKNEIMVDLKFFKHKFGHISLGICVLQLGVISPFMLSAIRRVAQT